MPRPYPPVELGKLFLSAPRYAVVGASKDQNKWGTKVLQWYQARDMIVTPVHPKEATLEGLQTIKTLNELTLPKETSVSIITPPSITLNLLKSAEELGVRSLWLQPGAEDDAVIDYVKNSELLKDKVILAGPCVLVQGDNIIQSLP